MESSRFNYTLKSLKMCDIARLLPLAKPSAAYWTVKELRTILKINLSCVFKQATGCVISVSLQPTHLSFYQQVETRKLRSFLHTHTSLPEPQEQW